MSTFSSKIIHSTHARSLRGAYSHYQQVMADPENTQLQKLGTILKQNQTAIYVDKWGGRGLFRSDNLIRAFQESFPIVGYAELEHWLENVSNSQSIVLSNHPTICWEPTSGSSAAKKWIPYSKALLKEFNDAINPWLAFLYANYPGVKSGRHYWSVSMANRASQDNPTDIPLGLPDDSHYLSPIARLATRHIMSVPGKVKHERTNEKWLQQTALYILKDETLALISVWSPTFLSVICQYILDQGQQLLRLLTRRRQQRLRNFFSEGAHNFERLWPQLALISCWTDGPAYTYAESLRLFFPRTPIQGKGLLTTEGVLTIPIHTAPRVGMISQGGVISVNSHFYEFLPSNSKGNETLLAHELQTGARYTPLITTNGGLYRYRINDIVECSGYHLQTPILKFVGKSEQISDVAGEKLHIDFLQAAIDKVKQNFTLDIRFLMVAPPAQAPGYYSLFLESNGSRIDCERFASLLERSLCESFHYQQCRAMGQLGPLNLCLTENGWQRYQTTLQEAGMKLGDIKPAIFNDRFPWLEILGKGSQSFSEKKTA